MDGLKCFQMGLWFTKLHLDSLEMKDRFWLELSTIFIFFAMCRENKYLKVRETEQLMDGQTLLPAAVNPIHPFL